MEIIRIEETSSTNTWVKERRGQLPVPSLVYAVSQTAGRGQRGNSWEAAPGMNLTASALFKPDGVLPCEQFAVSEAVALAVTDLLAEIGVAAEVKWPNDIYVGNGKICGILIEHSLTPSEILSTIAGIGINVNQTEFLSNAPNPVSVAGLTGTRFPVDVIARKLTESLRSRLESLASESTRCNLHREYMGKMWRADGREYPFRDNKRHEEFVGIIGDVAPDGILTVIAADSERHFAFKEVEFIL